MSFSEEIPTERILNFVALGDQELGTSEMQGPRKWKSIKTFQTLPKNGVGVGKKHDFRGLVESNGDEFVLQVSNDGLFQNIHKPGIMLKQMHHNPPYHRILLKLYTDPDHERRTFSILASRAMAYSKFVHPLGKSSGYGR